MKQDLQAKRYEHAAAILAFVACSWLALVNLGTLPVRLWDESRNANAAFEMLVNGFSIVVSFNWLPDLWSTKPATLTWIQCGLMHILGPNEVALRLPSAIAVVLCCAMLYLLSLRLTKGWYFGIIAALVLITIPGFNGDHTGRTGDYDAPLALCTAAASWFFFSAVNQQFAARRTVYLWITATTCAVLIKCVAGFFFVPAWAMWLTWQKQWKTALTCKALYIGIGGLIIAVGGMYAWREMAAPGYLEAVWYNELGGRYSEALEGHRHSFTYYLENMYHGRLGPYFYLVLAGVVLAPFTANKMLGKAVHFAAVMMVGFLLVVSSAKTKLLWYDNPVYPFAAFIAAFFLYEASMRMSAWLLRDVEHPGIRQAVATTLLFILVLYTPFAEAVNRNYKPRDEGEQFLSFRMTDIVQDYYHKGSNAPYDLTGYTLAYDEYDGNNLFYAKVMKHNGVRIGYHDVRNLEPGDSAVVGTPGAMAMAHELYIADTLWVDHSKVVMGIHIKEKR